MGDPNCEDFASNQSRSYSSPIIEAGMEVNSTSYRDFVDIMEVQIERFRSNVAFLEEEKDGILTALDSVRNSSFIFYSKPDEAIHIDRLSARMASVEVRVNTIRDDAQEDSLYEINSLIDRLILDMEKDIDSARARCLKFINTCGSQDNGPIDEKFERALLGCTLDDQKRIQKRLCGLKSYFDKLAVVSLND